ncbi:MAG TPA: hypothetical protein VFE23_06120 [Usitatibacter sp.]|jgi:hypothetical protein|nr:hypothetical protein [Usitatibacter sp.]
MTADRHSVNRAFRELGLRFQWDERTWDELCAIPDVREQLRYYLPRHQPHLLAVYDADFLGNLVAQRLARPGAGEISLESHAA